MDLDANVSMPTRPGRIDKTIKFGIMGEDEKRTVAQRILADIDSVTVDDVLEGTENWTAAQFKEKCCSIALEHYWKNTSTIGELDAEEKELNAGSIDKKAG